MQISYRALRLSLVTGLLGLGQVGMAQTAPPTREDSLKGRIWTATARRIWADTKPPQAQPAAWPTVKAFEDWLIATPTDKSELGLLRADVVKSFGEGTKVGPDQVAQAILTQAGKRQQSKKGRLTRLKVTDLKTDLAQLAQPKTAVAAATAPADSATPASTPQTSVSQVVTEDKNPMPERRAVPATTVVSTTAATAPRYFGFAPWLAGTVLALLGALAGAWLANAKHRRDRIERHRRSAQKAVEHTNKLHEMTPEESSLRQENYKLKSRIHHLEREVAELRAQLPGGPAPRPPLPPEEEALFDVTLAAPATQPAAAAEVPAPAATRYGPVQETPFLEERKIVDSPLPQLALMLTVNPRTPDQATFTLNPQVDQARLIGDGLTRLQKFFDYDPPVAGRITAVAAIKAGKLQRQDTGWQVVERARLLII